MRRLPVPFHSVDHSKRRLFAGNCVVRELYQGEEGEISRVYVFAQGALNKAKAMKQSKNTRLMRAIIISRY